MVADETQQQKASRVAKMKATKKANQARAQKAEEALRLLESGQLVQAGPESSEPIREPLLEAPGVHVPTNAAYGGEEAEEVAEAQTDSIGGVPPVPAYQGAPPVMPLPDPVEAHAGVDQPPARHEPDPMGQVHTAHEIQDPALMSSPQEKSEQQRYDEHQAALAEAARVRAEAANPFPVIQEEKQDGELLHFAVMQDGFSALGKVWYYGETITMVKGSQLWKNTLDRDGRSWTEQSEQEQIERRGSVYFKPGIFVKATRSDDAPTDDEEREALMSGDPEAMRRIEKRRQRAAISRPVGLPLASKR